MAVDFTVEMIKATVLVEQPLGNGTRVAGAGFLVNAPQKDGAPRVVLVTARHVFTQMPGEAARLGFRMQNPDGSWRLQPQEIPIREGAAGLWTQHPTEDVAVIAIQVPPEIARAAIPLAWIADEKAFDRYGVGPGDEMVTLGYPGGYSANTLGFPILRAGRIASYPLSPAAAFPTFLLDFTVMPGNSGGPVFMPEDARRANGLGGGRTTAFVAGVLTQNSASLDLGFVTHAMFVREAIALLDHPLPPPPPPPSPPAPPVETPPDDAPR